MKIHLTDRQKDVIRAIQDFRSDHGKNPTLKELGTAAGMSSTFSVRRHLTNLEKLGVVKPRPRRKARAIEIVDLERGFSAAA